MVQGHHSYQDGISQMQSFFNASDKPKGQEYPFFKKPSPSYLQWIAIFITAPISIYQYLSNYYAHKPDYNCIKKHSRYIDGVFKTCLSEKISMVKAKAKAKSMGVTFNDLVMGIVSCAVKEHFVE